jgi:hypothetical protein
MRPCFRVRGATCSTPSGLYSGFCYNSHDRSCLHALIEVRRVRDEDQALAHSRLPDSRRNIRACVFWLKHNFLLNSVRSVAGACSFHWDPCTFSWFKIQIIFSSINELIAFLGGSHRDRTYLETSSFFFSLIIRVED